MAAVNLRKFEKVCRACIRGRGQFPPEHLAPSLHERDDSVAYQVGWSLCIVSEVSWVKIVPPVGFCAKMWAAKRHILRAKQREDGLPDSPPVNKTAGLSA